MATKDKSTDLFPLYSVRFLACALTYVTSTKHDMAKGAIGEHVPECCRWWGVCILPVDSNHHSLLFTFRKTDLTQLTLQLLLYPPKGLNRGHCLNPHVRMTIIQWRLVRKLMMMKVQHWLWCPLISHQPSAVVTAFFQLSSSEVESGSGKIEQFFPSKNSARATLRTIYLHKLTTTFHCLEAKL